MFFVWIVLAVRIGFVSEQTGTHTKSNYESEYVDYG